MTVRRLSTLGRLLGAVALAACAGASSGAPTIVRPAIAAGQRYYPEVRLRKLHLVRPDLIPFPLDFDVYC